MMHQKELLLSESVAEQCAECMGHSSWIAEIGLSQRASWLLGLSKLITNSLISSPVCAFLHLSYNLVKVLGLLLPSESSAWLLSRKQCRARFHRGCSGVCVYVLCFSERSWSATENDLWHDLYNTAPKPTVQMLKIHSVCAVTSATTSMNHAVHKYAGKRSTRHRTTVDTLQSLSCPWC